MNEEIDSLEQPKKDCEQLLWLLEGFDKLSFKKATDQAKYARSLKIFIAQYEEYEKEVNKK